MLVPDTPYITIPPCFHEQSSVGDAEAQVPGPLGHHTEDGAQDWVDHNHLNKNAVEIQSKI